MRLKFLVIAALGVSMLAAADQPFDIRTGLWNITATLDAGNGIDTISKSSCITAEDIRNARLLQLSSNSGKSCTSEVTRQSASTLIGVIECSTASGESRTQVSFAASSPTKLVGTMQTTAAGSPHGVKVAITAEWSAATCPLSEEDDVEGDED